MVITLGECDFNTGCPPWEYGLENAGIIGDGSDLVIDEYSYFFLWSELCVDHLGFKSKSSLGLRGNTKEKYGDQYKK